MDKRDMIERPGEKLVSYGEYLRLGEILNAQTPGRPLLHHDEMLFIIVHQAYELWFKLILHELTAARDLLLGTPSPGGGSHVPEREIPRIVAHLTRVIETERVLVDQFRILETMPPLNFLAFRDHLAPASGFQSVQFRELEILAGLRDDARLGVVAGAADLALSLEERSRVEARRRERSLSDAIFEWLARTPIDVAYPGFVDAFLLAFEGYVGDQKRLHHANTMLPLEQRREVSRRLDEQLLACRTFLTGHEARTNLAHAAFLFISTYRTEPLLIWPYTLIDRVVEFEEYLRMWRFRHARMVERMIGIRVGTGGSPGVDYLDRTASTYRIFGDLLLGRNFLLPKDRLKDLPNASVFDFRFGNG